jgi:hypothetical protein
MFGESESSGFWKMEGEAPVCRFAANLAPSPRVLR